MTVNQTLENLYSTFPETDEKLPVLFIGHGSPMNAIEDNEFSQGWEFEGTTLATPKAILCISAHWETAGTAVTAMEQPKTIHDFGGFPKQLYEMQYPAPGSPGLAQEVVNYVKNPSIHLDQNWGLDHGTWSVLCRMFPKANIPVVQLSLDRTQPPAYHYALGKALYGLRRRGVLVIGSGNIVHNLRTVVFKDGEAYPWASEFDEMIRRLVVSGNHESVIHYEKLGQAANLSIPTNEHYLPLLYILALQDGQDTLRFFNDSVTYGSLSMRSIRFG